MSIEKKERTVSYRRADWINTDPATISLEMCVRQACLNLKSTDERSINRGDGQYVTILHAKDEQKSGYLLHITTETPGEAASVVPVMSKTIADADVSTVPPPKDFEFMDGDAFIFIKGNDLCLCAIGLRDGGIQYFFHEIFKKAKLRKDAVNFILIKVADIKKVALIQQHGVKEIEIRSTLFQASLDYQRRLMQPTGLMGVVSKHVKALIKKDNDVNHDALKASLTIKVDRRMDGVAIGGKRLVLLATEIVKNAEEQDDFAIITNDDQKISPHEIFVRTTVHIEKSGKSVDRESAWKELKHFHKKLASSGMLEI